MANERLSDLTEAELLEVALANERIRLEVAGKDPRVQLFEKLYGDADSRREIQKHAKRLFPKSSIVEVDVPEETTKRLREELKPDLDAIKALRKDLETEKMSRAHASFRARLQEAGAVEKDLDQIEQFMVDNEIGPKSLQVAVDKFYETAETAEPRTTEFDWEDPNAEHMKALLNAAPGADLDKINEPWVRKVWEETVAGAIPGGRARRRT